MKGLGVVVVLVGALASPRSAEACHYGTGITILFFGVAQVGINTPLTIHNLVVPSSSRGYGIAETVLTVPGVVVGGLLARRSFMTCDDDGEVRAIATRGQQVFTLGMVGWSAALLAHGIYTITRPRSATATTTALVPVPVTSEQGELLGFGLAGRF